MAIEFSLSSGLKGGAQKKRKAYGKRTWGAKSIRKREKMKGKPHPKKGKVKQRFNLDT